MNMFGRLFTEVHLHGKVNAGARDTAWQAKAWWGEGVAGVAEKLWVRGQMSICKEKHENEVDVQKEGMQEREKYSRSNPYTGRFLSSVLVICETACCVKTNPY